MTDSKYMEMAIELAARGAGYTSPNPMVGAVIVKDGQIIGAGYHERCGQLHAERNALADCRRRGNDPEGAAIYVTLEPCCHYGKTLHRGHHRKQAGKSHHRFQRPQSPGQRQRRADPAKSRNPGDGRLHERGM